MMKNAMLTSVIFCIFWLSGMQPNTAADKTEIIYGPEAYSEMQVMSASFFPSEVITIDLRKDFNLRVESILEVLVIIIMCCALLAIVLTPVVLVYFWIYYSYRYVCNYRDRFSLKKWFKKTSDLYEVKVSKRVWFKYRKTYSKMLGFGFSILAYCLASNFYMFRNFDRLEVALVNYFSFPFKVLDNISKLRVLDENNLALEEIWKEMLLIVFVSIAIFFLGYMIGTMIVNFRYRRVKKWFGENNRRHGSSKMIILE